MSSLFGRWVGYGFGVAAAKALFAADRKKRSEPPQPVRARTEEEILADEKRFDEDEKRIEDARADAEGVHEQGSRKR